MMVNLSIIKSEKIWMKLKEQNTKTEESESKLAMKQTAIDNLVTNKNDVMEKVARCYRDMGIEFN